MVLHELLILEGRELRATVRVLGHRIPARALPGGYENGFQNEMALLPRRHRPTTLRPHGTMTTQS